MTKVMKFPKGVRAVKRPTMRNHRGRTWDVCEVILPDGSTIQGHLDTSWSLYFYFQVDGVWRRGEIGRHELGHRFALVMDLRDQDALKAFETKLGQYEALIFAGDAEAADELGWEVEQEADRIGYNNHKRLMALHTQAELMGAPA